MDDDELFDDAEEGEFDPFADLTDDDINEATLIADDDLSEMIGALR